MSDYNQLALLLFGILGWSLSLYFGFFRFKHFIWARNKVTYDLFTRQNHRLQALFNRLLRLSQLERSNTRLEGKRRAVANSYLEQLRETCFLIRSEVVTEEQARYWLERILDQLRALQSGGAAGTGLLDARQQDLRFPVQLLPALLAEAQSDRPDAQKLYQLILRQN